MRQYRTDRSTIGLMQRGFTLIEMSIVLAIIGMMMVAYGKFMVSTAQDSKAYKIADEAVVIAGGVNTYASQNFEALIFGKPVTGVATPLSPTVQELISLGLLNAGVTPTNSQGTGWLIQLTKEPAGCVAPACDIASLVTTNAPILDSDGTPNTKLISTAATRIGGNGGTSTPDAPSVIAGQDSSWTKPNPLGVDGVLGVRGGFGAAGYSQFVRQGDSRYITLSNGLNVTGASGVSTTNVLASGNMAVTGTTTLTGAAVANGGVTTPALTATGAGVTTTALNASGNAVISGSTSMAGTTLIGPTGVAVTNASVRVTNGGISTATAQGYGTLINGVNSTGDASIYTTQPGGAYSQLVNGASWGAAWNGLYTSQGSYLNGAAGTLGTSTVNASTGNISTVNAATVGASTGNITTVNASTGNISTVNGSTGNLTTLNSSTGNISTANINTLNLTLAHGSVSAPCGGTASFSVPLSLPSGSVTLTLSTQGGSGGTSGAGGGGTGGGSGAGGQGGFGGYGNGTTTAGGANTSLSAGAWAGRNGAGSGGFLTGAGGGGAAIFVGSTLVLASGGGGGGGGCSICGPAGGGGGYGTGSDGGFGFGANGGSGYGSATTVLAQSFTIVTLVSGPGGSPNGTCGAASVSW